MDVRLGWLTSAVLICAACSAAGHRAHAQASAIPSADPAASAGVDRGRVLLDQMVAALGGEAWLNRRDWQATGKTDSFYKGQPQGEVVGFEEYHRQQPWATRLVILTHYGMILPKDHADVAELFTPDAGYEITFKGVHPLPAKDTTEVMRRRDHSLETVVEWLRDPATIVTYDGIAEVQRRQADKVSVLNAHNDAITLELDRSTHLPRARSFQYRDPQFGDFDVDREEYDNYQNEGGVMTPLTVTRYHNGDMVGQRFLLTIKYNAGLDASLFDPSRALVKKK